MPQKRRKRRVGLKENGNMERGEIGWKENPSVKGEGLKENDNVERRVGRKENENLGLNTNKNTEREGLD